MRARLKFLIQQSITVPIAVALIVFLLHIFRVVDFHEADSLDLRFRLRGAQKAHSKIVLITIDDKSLAELGEWAKWQRILEARPDLAPATAQPGVRDVADGIPGKLDITRADQLRALGNAVVEMQAAVAFEILFERLEPKT